jgi:hypothetical protein
MAIPFWDEFSEGYEGDVYPRQEWNRVQLGGFVLPGKCEVDGSAKHRIDVQTANGRDGGVLIERGYQPGTLDIDMTLWTPLQWSTWNAMRPSIFRRAGKLDVNDTKKKGATAAQIDLTEKAALPIVHPGAESIDIHSVLVEQITLPRPGQQRGSKVITIKCIEYVPPSKVKATRKAAGIAAPPIDPRQKFAPAANKPASPAEDGTAAKP